MTIGSLRRIRRRTKNQRRIKAIKKNLLRVKIARLIYHKYAVIGVIKKVIMQEIAIQRKKPD
jgi:hypothetical protein